jgi:hypothetical protein
LKTIGRSGTVLAVFVCALGAAVGMQVKSAAYVSDLSSHPDEAGHFVSALLITDYVRIGRLQNPLRFAKNYYVHFPKVAIGHWPPLFHLIQGTWMLAFGRNKVAVFILLALLAATLAAGVFRLVLPDCGTAAAAMAAAVLVSTPFMQTSVSSVMSDLLLSLLAFGTVAAWGAYLDQGRSRDAKLAIALFVACLATNGRGFAVGLACVLAGSLAARTPAARLRYRWATAVALAVIVLPGIRGWPLPLTPGMLANHFAQFGMLLVDQLTLPAALLALFGAIIVWRSRKEQPGWTAILCLLVATWIFHGLLAVSLESRYLAGSIPAAVVLIAIGSSRLLRQKSKVLAACLAIGACLVVGWNATKFSAKPDLGYHTLVNGSSDIARSNRISLIAGDPLHEGAYIAEMDLADPLLHHVILRGSKVLASSTWAGNQYRMRFHDADQVTAYLDQSAVGLVILQTTGPPHVAQLLQAVTGSAAWRESEAATALLRHARVFERIGPLPNTRSPITIDMRDSLGEELHLDE